MTRIEWRDEFRETEYHYFLTNFAYNNTFEQASEIGNSVDQCVQNLKSSPQMGSLKNKHGSWELRGASIGHPPQNPYFLWYRYHPDLRTIQIVRISKIEPVVW